MNDLFNILQEVYIFENLPNHLVDHLINLMPVISNDKYTVVFSEDFISTFEEDIQEEYLDYCKTC